MKMILADASLKQMIVIYCLNSTYGVSPLGKQMTADVNFHSTNHLNRCPIFTDISEQLIQFISRAYCLIFPLLPPQTGELGDIVSAGATVCDT